jgi:hypothetical protein
MIITFNKFNCVEMHNFRLVTWHASRPLTLRRLCQYLRDVSMRKQQEHRVQELLLLKCEAVTYIIHIWSSSPITNY